MNLRCCNRKRRAPSRRIIRRKSERHSAIDMGAMVVKEAVSRAGIRPSDVNEVIVGQVGEIAQDGFVARAVSLKAGMLKSVLHIP